MIEIFLLAVALAMDCFTVSMAAGMIAGRRNGWLMVRLAFLFGLYQAAMPLLGWLLMHLVDGEAIRQVDHWIAFSMLAFIGGKMVFDAFSEDKDQPALDVTSWKARHLLAVATSIDALAVGITFACTGYVRLGQLTVPLLVIGVVSFVLSVAGFLIGVGSGKAVQKKIRPELLGGVILIGIGTKILLEHLLAG